MRSTRKSALAAGAAFAVLFAGACGGGSGAGDASGGDSSAGGEEAKTIKLVAAEYSKDNTKAFWDAFAKTYKDKTGYTLEVQVVSWDTIDQQSSTMIQNNQAPDILNLNVYASYAKDGLLWNADEVLSADKKSDILDAFVTSGTSSRTGTGSIGRSGAAGRCGLRCHSPSTFSIGVRLPSSATATKRLLPIWSAFATIS